MNTEACIANYMWTFSDHFLTCLSNHFSGWPNGLNVPNGPNVLNGPNVPISCTDCNMGLQIK